MWGITPAYLQCTGIIIHDSFTNQFTLTDEQSTFKYPSALILHGTEQKSMFRLYRETTLGALRSHACLFFQLFIDLVRDTASLHQFCLLTSLAHHSYTSLDNQTNESELPARPEAFSQPHHAPSYTSNVLLPASAV